MLRLAASCCCRELGKLLHANVMGYDYTGYGPSTSLPSVSHTLSDISGVLGMLRGQHNIAPADVVLYGQSVGSGPTVSRVQGLVRVQGLGVVGSRGVGRVQGKGVGCWVCDQHPTAACQCAKVQHFHMTCCVQPCQRWTPAGAVPQCLTCQR